VDGPADMPSLLRPAYFIVFIGTPCGMTIGIQGKILKGGKKYQARDHSQTFTHLRYFTKAFDHGGNSKSNNLSGIVTPRTKNFQILSTASARIYASALPLKQPAPNEISFAASTKFDFN
jgi:hypothetical protein